MSKDKLKEFIDSNREEFDSQSPDSKVWHKISGELDNAVKEKANVRSLFPKWALNIAASILVAVTSIVIYESFDQEVIYQSEVAIKEPEVEKTTDLKASPLKRELLETEVVYRNKINHKLSLLNSYEHTYPGINNEVKSEIDALDKVYDELKAEANKGIEDEELVRAMIENYQIKLEILEEILMQLKEVDTQNTIHHETYL